MAFEPQHAAIHGGEIGGLSGGGLQLGSETQSAPGCGGLKKTIRHSVSTRSEEGKTGSLQTEE